ncbi:hypothetical protein CY0110_30900 [Crocosphaera chwakensis CCY0110]|uniref:Uncharacterized protein n=1 Tax=Crocosphaera chwakensis CCY0110 TaxID=391612 RepID=A3IVZ3_9CHRO|nr:hypothetical protein CY0110_30900 [Crocosphaera chwakensis CCY0110]
MAAMKAGKTTTGVATKKEHTPDPKYIFIFILVVRA